MWNDGTQTPSLAESGRGCNLGDKARRLSASPALLPRKWSPTVASPGGSPELVPTEVSWGQQALVLARRTLIHHAYKDRSQPVSLPSGY